MTSAQTTLATSIMGDLAPQNWLLLFFGLLMYWLKNLDSANKEAKGEPYIDKFWADNRIEIPVSILSCIVLAMMSGSFTDMIDMNKPVASFITGFFASSVLNYVITRSKPTFINQNSNTQPPTPDKP